jgi:hypothetical protein
MIAWWTTPVLAALLPTPVLAHTTIPGIGSFSAAFAHVTMEPPAALALLGLGLLAGMHDAATLKWTWAAFLAAMAAGVALTLVIGVIADPELPLLLVALVSGVATASGLGLPKVAAGAVGVLAGAVFGTFATPAPASWSTQAYFVSGGIIGANFALIWIASAVAMARERWPVQVVFIGLRVAASWVAAIAALLAALATR